MSSDSDTFICCCDTLQFDGKCFDGDGTLIATCFNSLNETVAECHQGTNTNENTVMECFISECPLAEFDSLIARKYCFIFGGVLFLVGSALHECRYSESNIIRKRFGDCDFLRTSNHSFITSTVSTLGVQVLVLGGITGNSLHFDRTLIVLALMQFFELLVIIRRTYYMITHVPSEDNEDSKEEVTVHPSDTYDDITTPITRVMFLFLCQITLLSFYITAIYMAGSADFTKTGPYLFFIIGVFVQICYQEAKDKKPSIYFEKKIDYWRIIMDAKKERENKTVVECVDDVDYKRFIPEISLVARIIMSNLVNGQGTSMLMYLLPLHLSHSTDAIDFVLNAVAAYIIVELDDAVKCEKITLIKGKNEEENNSVREDEDICGDSNGSKAGNQLTRKETPGLEVEETIEADTTGDANRASIIDTKSIEITFGNARDDIEETHPLCVNNSNRENQRQ